MTLWTVARQAPLSMGFPRQEHWSGLPFPPPGDLPIPGIEHQSLVSPALYHCATWEASGLRVKNKPGGFPGGPEIKDPPANAGRVGSIPGQGPKISRALGPKIKT